MFSLAPMTSRSTSDLLVQIALVVGAIFVAAAVFKMAVGLLAFFAPVLLLLVAAYVVWHFVEKVQARRS